jgi:hypothetical protein
MDTLSAGPHAVDELYVCKLDAATELKAINELNEDPKDRLNAVRALRTWLLQQPHITFPTGFFSVLLFNHNSTNSINGLCGRTYDVMSSKMAPVKRSQHVPYILSL